MGNFSGRYLHNEMKSVRLIHHFQYTSWTERIPEKCTFLPRGKENGFMFISGQIFRFMENRKEQCPSIILSVIIRAAPCLTKVITNIGHTRENTKKS